MSTNLATRWDLDELIAPLVRRLPPEEQPVRYQQLSDLMLNKSPDKWIDIVQALDKISPERLPGVIEGAAGGGNMVVYAPTTVYNIHIDSSDRSDRSDHSVRTQTRTDTQHSGYTYGTNFWLCYGAVGAVLLVIARFLVIGLPAPSSRPVMTPTPQREVSQYAR